ncbi:MAG: hypothetical protein PHS93_09755 [Candidatus Omnitrophica bacterium]|nr:hypothetical protein [Candidatus Omnitrophota bacterium]
MSFEAPWTQLGELQQEILNLKNNLHEKANNYEIHSTNSRLDSLEHSLREISAALDGIKLRLQVWEDKVNP